MATSGRKQLRDLGGKQSEEVLKNYSTHATKQADIGKKA